VSLLWALPVGLVFFAVYPLSNWLTARRANPLHLYFDWELAIPLVPEFVWAYLSMYLLFLVPPLFLAAAKFPTLGKQLIVGTLIGGVVFLAAPAVLGFERSLPLQAPYRDIFAGLHGIDAPHNLVPSLHVVFSTLIALACADFARPSVRVALWAWLAVIVASTVLVHQHHVIDLVAALGLAAWLRRRWPLTTARA